MPFTYTLDHDSRTMHTIASGVVTLEDIRGHLAEEEGDGGLGYIELIDGRTATPSLSSADVRAVVSILRDLAAGQPLGPTAILVATDYAFGLMRMLGMLVEEYCSVRPFRDQAEADAWLRKPVDAD